MGLHSAMWLFPLFVLMFVNKALSVRCLDCADVTKGNTCTQIKTCGSNEVCYTQLMASSSGRIYRKMGCRDKMHCPIASSLVGRKRQGADTVMCEQCCDQDLCQVQLCGDDAFNTTAAPVCYHCSNMRTENDCNTIQHCPGDQVCNLAFGHDHTYTAGCFDRQRCAKILLNFGAFPSGVGECFKCCSTQLCNDACAYFGSTTTTHAPGTTLPISVDTCKDSTGLATCQIASSFVCASMEKAQNAGCLNYCGYCGIEKK